MSDQADDPFVFQRLSRARRREIRSTVDEQRGPLLHERLPPCNEVFLKEWPVIRFSPDGRLAFLLFERDLQLQVVDLVRNTQMHRVQGLSYPRVGRLRLGCDGRLLFGLPTYSRELDTLHVFDIEQRAWSTKQLTGELEGCTFAWAEDRVFLSGYEEVDGECRYSVSCLDLQQLAWTKLPIVADSIRCISAIVDEESGEAVGLVVMNEDESGGKMKVFRLLFRTPDSLVRLAVDALRRHNLDVVGKEEFHAVMNGPCKSVFPSLYAGMTPILRL
ncbi:hypothetical protein M3Y99_00139100 [Aphelenchoides fujianensis]|nr:hypothetical protein M3Y99_00139100 [Aphelenchoides fujianensis]